METKPVFDPETIAAFCKKWKIVEFALFGSVLRDDFKPDSDVDVLVTFAPESKVNLFDLALAKLELESLMGRNVDLLTRKSVQESRNWMRRREILSTSRVIHAQH